MDKEQMAGKLQQLKGKIKQQWGRLTDDDIALYEGHKDEFLGKLKEKYGLEKDAAEQRLQEMEAQGQTMGDQNSDLDSDRDTDRGRL